MPKTVEVDELEYQRKSRVYDTLAGIAKNPKAAKLLEEAHKLVDPNVSTPALDAEKAQNEQFTNLTKKVDDFLEAQRAEKDKTETEAKKAAFEAKWSLGQKRLKDAGWTPDGIKALEDMMAEKGIVDHDDARKLWEVDHPPATPAMPGGTGAWNFLETPIEEKDSDLKRLIQTKGDSDVLADKMARDALNEFRQEISRNIRR